MVDPPAWRIERQGEREIVLRLHDESLRRYAEAMTRLETADAEFAIAPKDVGVAKEDWVWFWR